MVRMTYQKSSGEVVIKESFQSQYKIGDENSYGWKVINKEHLWKGKYYPYTEFDRLLDNAIKRDRFFSQLKKRLYSFYRELGYSVFLLILLRVFESLLKK